MPAAELNAANNWDLRIHVDAASGGQLGPLMHVACDLPGLVWACFSMACACAVQVWSLPDCRLRRAFHLP